MIKKSEVVCYYCGKTFLKSNGEINRNKRVGRNNYCNNKCSGQVNKKYLKLVDPKNQYDISQHCKNRLDDNSGLKPLFKMLKNTNRKECLVTLQDLKSQWDSQGGICPFTGILLKLKNYANWKRGEKTIKNLYQASIDRIDNDKPYEVGNIRFVCLIANYARNTFTDEELLDFCERVTNYKNQKK